MQATEIITPDQRRELCAATVTLDGKPARISGYRAEYATVRDAATGLGAEWPWATVARVVASGGAFTDAARDDDLARWHAQVPA